MKILKVIFVATFVAFAEARDERLRGAMTPSETVVGNANLLENESLANDATLVEDKDQTLVKGGQSLLVAKKRARGFGKYVQKFRSKITHRNQDDAKAPVETSDGFPGAGLEAIMSSANESDANRATVNAIPACDGRNSGNTDSCCTSSNKCGVGQGDCDGDWGCQTGLKCGVDNCLRDFGWGPRAAHDCCYKEVCPLEKRVTMYKFCINGSCDAGAEGEHKLKLDGHFLASGFKSFREGQCHNLHYPSVIVDQWQSLTVGTEEEDDFSENDSWLATMSAKSWYSESCKPYEIRLAEEHEEEKAHTQCWTAEAGGSVKGVDLGLSSETCTSWTAPAQSFEFMLKVEPAWPMCSSQGLAQREQDICISAREHFPLEWRHVESMVLQKVSGNFWLQGF